MCQRSSRLYTGVVFITSYVYGGLSGAGLAEAIQLVCDRLGLINVPKVIPSVYGVVFVTSYVYGGLSGAGLAEAIELVCDRLGLINVPEVIPSVYGGGVYY